MNVTRRSFLDRLLGRKSANEAPLSVVTSLSPYLWRQWDAQTYCEEGYAGNPYVYRAVSFLSSALGSLPWCLYQRDSDGELEEIEDTSHQLLAVLRRPNPLTGGSALMQALGTQLLVTGRAHVLKVGPGRPGSTTSPPRELYLLPSTAMEMIRGQRQDIVGWRYSTGTGAVTTYQPEDVIYLHMQHTTDPLDGMPPLAAAARSVDIANEARRWNMALLQNGARPSGVFSVEGRMADEDYQRAKEDMRRELSGSNQAGIPLLLEGGATWTQTGLSPDDMSWYEMTRTSLREIAIVYHLPVQILGDTESSTYSNYKIAVAAAWREGVLPLAVMIRDELNNQLTPEYGEGLYLDYDPDDIDALAEDTDSQWGRLTEAVNAGVISRNEARSALGYSAVEGGDELTMPATQVPISGGLGEEDLGST